MEKYLLFILTSAFCFQSYSQINFEEGYYTDNNGKVHRGLIKNYDWRSNPELIEFKASEDAEVANIKKEDIQEFLIDNSSKFRRFTVDVDRSSDSEKNLSRQRNPEYTKEILLLRVLLEGDANLYQYTDANIIRFFYSVNNSRVQPLISKRFQIDNNIMTNSRFRQQLLDDLNCGSKTQADVRNLQYSRAELVKYFKEYNECKGSGSKDFESRTKGVFNLKIKAGVNYTSLKIARQGSLFARSNEVDFGSKVNPTVGVEAEYLLPFNKNKWAVFIEPSYQAFKAEKEYNYESYNAESITNFYIDYTSLSAPLGLKYYFFVGDQSKISVSAALMVNYYLNSEIGDSEEVFLNEMEIKEFSKNFELGVGYTLRNKFSVEMRYGLPREIFEDHPSSTSSSFGAWEPIGNSVVTVMLGYNLF